MPIDDSAHDNLFPPPDFRDEQLGKMRHYQWMLGRDSPLISGFGGAVAGGIMLPICVLAFMYLIKYAGIPVASLLVLIITAAIGAGFGFICAYAYCIVGRAIVRYWMAQHSRH